MAASAFDAPTERMTSITPLLYQSGYVTIKDYDELADLYYLDLPNKEVRIGLMESLLEGYVGHERDEAVTTVAFLSRAIIQDKMDEALRLLQTFLSTVPYCGNTDYEGYYQQMLYVIFSLMGKFVDVEIRTPRGRVDLVIRTATNAPGAGRPRDPHCHQTLSARIEAGQERRRGHASNRPEELSRTLRPLRSAHREGRHQLR